MFNKKKNQGIEQAKKRLLNWFKTAYLIKRNIGVKIPDKVKKELYDLVNDCETLELLDLFELNKVKIINSIPDEKKEMYCSQLYMHLLGLIKVKFKDINNKYMFEDKENSNMSLFTLLEDVREINFKGRMSVLIDNINSSDIEIKTRCYLLLFELVNKIDSYELFDNINSFIKNEKNPEKLYQMYLILLKSRYIKFDNKDMNIRDILNTFIKFIKDNPTNKYFSELINNIFKDDIINYIDINEYDNILNILLAILVTPSYIIGENNIRLLLNLSKDKRFIFMKDKDIQNKLISLIMDISIDSEEYRCALEKIIREKILSFEDKVVVKLYTLNDLNELKSLIVHDESKSLVLKNNNYKE